MPKSSTDRRTPIPCSRAIVSIAVARSPIRLRCELELELVAEYSVARQQRIDLVRGAFRLFIGKRTPQ